MCHILDPDVLVIAESTTLRGYIDDLFITSFSDKTKKLIIRGYHYDSDHFTIKAFIDWSENKLQLPKRKVDDMNKGNFKRLKIHLESN